MTIIKNIHEIRSHYNNTAKTKKQTTLTEDTDDASLLWRCANQSLFADIIVALTTPMGLIRPQMEAGTTVEDIAFELNFGNDNNNKSAPPHVQAECFLNVSIPDIIDDYNINPKKRDTENDRLSLMRIQLKVYFCPSELEFRAEVEQVVPYSKLSESQLHRAATELSLVPPPPSEEDDDYDDEEETGATVS
eukprot:CAMPEP_0194184568 /NCGR_PEP_ID=MMETSP0154-20130528/38667_1 /TAXON_ID=1049557 /ORGANISM="Thalassiothrix antarctica, Strain L6-D1" /LENGTH=190 /DNA_ID=CAMNT_0038902329 /DNA_START=59 /DNA_END=628 /DNA_ORIENTATION=+